jgi:glutamate formiminotransferase/glutamate formiminotransferase/formiminotetrahydrofolate cyclodeaminase
VVYLDEAQRGPACAEALTAAGLIGAELDLPVFLYGQLATSEDRRERADLRRGGPVRLAQRIASGGLRPDHGPARAHPSAGALLMTARSPLLAFNVDLESEDVQLAKRIAAGLRESGGGPPGVRAIGLYLPSRGRAQVSINVHDHRVAPLRDLVEIVQSQAEIAEAELVGLAPSAAFEGFPDGIPLRNFDPERHLIENALRSAV